MSDGLSDLNYPIRLCYHYYADQKGKPTRKTPLHKGDIGVYVFVDDCLCGSKHVHSPEPGHRFSHCSTNKYYPNGYTLRLVDSEDSAVEAQPSLFPL